MVPFQNCVRHLSLPFKMAAIAKIKISKIFRGCFNICQNEFKF